MTIRYRLGKMTGVTAWSKAFLLEYSCPNTSEIKDLTTIQASVSYRRPETVLSPASPWNL
ncbi:hypothetical protein ACFL3H_04965 [Gemmatimonadota bacterium]